MYIFHYKKISIYQKYIKRLFDIFLCSVALIILSPIFIILYFIIKIFDGSPSIYWSDRVGINSSIFRMPKFRSMILNTPEVATSKLANQKMYVTCIGNFIRKTSIDELPQLWSVLIGQMSLVGPRPALFNQHDLIKKREELGLNKIKPGLSGWAQINGRDNLSIDEKIKYEYEYMNNMSLCLDLKIILLTIFMVLLRKNTAH